MALPNSRIIINLLPHELCVGFIVNGSKQFLKSVPLVYTVENGNTDKLIFGLTSTLLLDTALNSYETYQILDKNFDVVVADHVFESFIHYLYSEVLGIEDWKENSDVTTQTVLVFQHVLQEDLTRSFAANLRKLFFDHKLHVPVYQFDTDLITSMYYSTVSSIEKANIIINLQESFSSTNVYSNGIELYRDATSLSGSFLNYRLSECGVVSSSTQSSSTKHWQDTYTWLTSCRNTMLNFVAVGDSPADFETLKQYYNSKGNDFLYYKDHSNSLKIDLADLEKIKKEYLYDGFGAAVSVRKLIEDTIENSMPLKIQLFNKNDDSEKTNSDISGSNENRSFEEHIKKEYPKQEKSYAYTVVKNSDPQSRTGLNKIVVRIASNLTIIPFFLQTVKTVIKDKLANLGYHPSDYEVVIDEDFNSWEIVSKFAVSCGDRDVLLALNRN